MSDQQTPPEDTRNVAGFDVSPDIAAGASTATHMVANFIPNPMIGGVLDFAASTVDMETNQHNFVKTWQSAIARKLGVSAQELEGDNGVALVSTHINELPASLQNEWNKIEDLESKTSTFIVGGFAQIGGGALIGMLLGSVLLPPLGMIIGFAGGAAAGYAASLLMKDVTGDYDELSATEVIPAIHQSALQLQQQTGNSKAVPIDTTLLGTYLIAAHSAKGDVLEGYNTEDLKRMFNEHLAAKASDPHKQTELDEYIQGLNRSDENPFVLLLPKDIDPEKIKGGGVLSTIALNMHSQHDLENWLFDPAATSASLSQHQQHPASLNQAELRHAGKSLHQAIDVPMNEQGVPVGHKNSGQYLGS